jgi:hypothetical protein
MAENCSFGVKQQLLIHSKCTHLISYPFTAITTRIKTVMEAQTANRNWKEIYVTINTRWHQWKRNTSLVGCPGDIKNTFLIVYFYNNKKSIIKQKY